MRKFTGVGRLVIGLLLVAFTIFQLYTEVQMVLPTFVKNSIHLLFAFSLVLLLYPPIKNNTQRRYLVIDMILCVAVAAFSIRMVLTGNIGIPPEQVARPSVRDLIFGLLLILVTLETVRRTIGMGLVITALVFIAYAFAGPFIPGVLAHEGISPVYFVSVNYLSELGSFGSMATLSSGMLFAVIAFGAFMFYLGSGALMIKLAVAVAGAFRGGPAKVAVVGSALFGTISGSAVANVATVGVFTIPMMKRTGYEPVFAGAVEACASTGGQIMPPVMGITAFIMCDFLGIPYGKLILYAAIPAIFYYLTCFIQVHLEAVKKDLSPTPSDEVREARHIPVVDWILLLPIAVLVYLLVGLQMGIIFAAFYSVVSVWVCFAVHELVTKRRLDIKRLALSFEQPARQILMIACSLALMALVIYCFDISGLASKLSDALLELAGHNIWMLLFMTMIACLILGMGLPTMAAYIFLAIAAAPALVEVGILPLAAHMFIFYFGIISALTPPVCPASYVAAGIAGADFVKVGIQGVKLGIAGYIVPYMFVMQPALLLQGGSVLTIIISCFTLFVASFALAVTVEGYFMQKVTLLWRIETAIAAACLVVPRSWNYLVGYVLLALFVVAQLLASRKVKLARAANSDTAVT